MTASPLRTLIVDDSVFYQKILTRIFRSFANIEVVGTAPNGRIALQKINEMEVDFITLDYEMPEMDGLQMLKEMLRQQRDITVVMVSNYTLTGARITVEALELGAFDFITKPSGDSSEKNEQRLITQMRPIVTAVITQRILNRIKGKAVTGTAVPRVFPAAGGKKPVDIIVIGISTGGPNALVEVIPKLPADLAVPIIVVQHMPTMFTDALAESLAKKSHLKVIEAKNASTLEAGTVYIAPGGRQTKVVHDSASNALRLEINDDPPENHCQPSVDYLFRSIAEHYRNRAIGVIMTGMGNDGVQGLRLMKEYGAQTIAQDKETCVVFGMPCEAIKAGIIDEILPLQEIGPTLVKKLP